jgi:putative transposase
VPLISGVYIAASQWRYSHGHGPTESRTCVGDVRAGARRAHWHIHFIPTYSSWLNQVERFFALITGKAIRRSSFTSVKDLVGKINHFVTRYNTNCKPFTWTVTADSIVQKLERLTSRIRGTGH